MEANETHNLPISICVSRKDMNTFISRSISVTVITVKGTVNLGPTVGKTNDVILTNSCFFYWQLFHLLYFMFKHTMFVAWNLDKTEPRREP